MLLAVFYSFLDLQSRINNTPVGAQKPLVGAEAIKSLTNIASRIR